MHGLGPWILAGLLSLVLFAFVGFSLLLIGAALFERHPIQSLTAIAPDAVPVLSPYATEMNAQVRDAGFACLGTFGAAKGGMYKTVTTAWLSPDRTTRVLVVGGTIAALRTRRTTLTTRTADRRELLTTDEFGTRDLTASTDRQIVLNAHFPELWQIHQSRVYRMESIVPLYESEDVAAQLANDASRHAQRLVERGYARFDDSSNAAWRYTWKGALKIWFDMIVHGLAEAGSYQGRSKLRRPGG